MREEEMGFSPFTWISNREDWKWSFSDWNWKFSFSFLRMREEEMGFFFPRYLNFQREELFWLESKQLYEENKGKKRWVFCPLWDFPIRGIGGEEFLVGFERSLLPFSVYREEQLMKKTGSSTNSHLSWIFFHWLDIYKVPWMPLKLRKCHLIVRKATTMSRSLAGKKPTSTNIWVVHKYNCSPRYHGMQPYIIGWIAVWDVHNGLNGVCLN